MPLLNYTTKVSTSKTISEMQKLLVGAGARSISTEYSDTGDAVGMAFVIQTSYGPRRFVLPVNAGPVELVLKRERVERRFATPEQAERVAWRIVKDWLEAQLAIIRTEMVTLDQVMLPYMTENGVTFYELYRSEQLALPAGEG